MNCERCRAEDGKPEHYGKPGCFYNNVYELKLYPQVTICQTIIWHSEEKLESYRNADLKKYGVL